MLTLFPTVVTDADLRKSLRLQIAGYTVCIMVRGWKSGGSKEKVDLYLRHKPASLDITQVIINIHTN